MLAATLVLLVLFLVRGLPLRSEVIFNTHPFGCTEKYQWNTLEWQNHGVKLVRKAQVWGGMNAGAVADLGFFVVRKSDNTNLAIGNQDHYKDGELFLMYDFAPDYILLLPGDTLVLGYHCNIWKEQDAKGHIIFTIWYSGY